MLDEPDHPAVVPGPSGRANARPGRDAPAPPPRPISPAERIDAIDVLRGLALLGVLAINVVTIFRVSIFERFLPQNALASPIDSAVETILMLAVDLKALALFSLLFGAGLAIQFESRSEDAELARLVESTVWINEAHPAFRRAVASRSEGYHLALAVAMALGPLAVAPAEEHNFITAFLSRWGEAVEKTASRRSAR